ncbi:fatty acyl-CoA reductase wat-like [Culex pipiens pallens]|uniref:fatty acyl-CoA reductase wat-like n=1 Tax=Culex pipiens pallens TaxID=42434 RepID=UPI0019545A92|nr:fatty acyl-CoA reductase wat-like [Culex pipiens pallens]
MGDIIVSGPAGRPSSVVNFYKDSVVLITGGTGFIGKVLIEKILRCFEVKRIYLLLREKRNVKAADRLKEIFQEPLFDTIRNNHRDPAGTFAKVVAINTNFTQDQIISETDRELLLSEVTVVLNVMASVKFNECIEAALETNVICSRKLFDMASRMKHLKSIVHVSTFYSTCDRSDIKEQISNDIPFGGHDNILQILSHLQEQEKVQLTPLILGKMPNSYTFSKKCAEVMIQNHYNHLPIAIFRPPIVVSAYQEPIPGWVDNFNGLSGMCVALIQGRVYRGYGDPSYRCHTVPVDYCVSALLTVAAEAAAERAEIPEQRKVPVINFATDANTMLWGEFGREAAAGCETVLGRFFGRYALGVTTSRFVHRLFVWWFILQAAFADLMLVLVGKKRKHLCMVNRIMALEEAACHFSQHSWSAENANMRAIWANLSAEDRKVLPFDIDSLDWKDYFRHFLPGIKAALERCLQRRKSKCA